MRQSTRAEILGDIARRAPGYTPEWHCDFDSPDAGTALACLWADMFEGTLRRFERLPDNYHSALLDAIGSEPLPAVCAKGYLAFMMREDAGEAVIPKGVAVLSPSNPEASLIADHEFYASPAKITDIYCVLPERDAVERYDRESGAKLFRASRGEHVWTFSHEFAFHVSRAAALRIVPSMEDGDMDVLASSPWEYLDGENWRGMAVTRDASSLLCSFPDDKEGRCGALRVTLARENANDAKLLAFIAKPFGLELFPDALYADSTQEADGFFPFGQRFLPGVCAYFASADALAKPGARIELAFTLSYDEFDIEGYPEMEMRMRRLMRVSEFIPPEEYEITAAQVKWEYFNRLGWAALEVDNEADLFAGRISGRVKIAFTCPDTLTPAVVGAHDLPFIRVRLVAADNLFRQRGHYKAPRLSDVRFAYSYPDGVPITQVHVSEHLDARDTKLPVHLTPRPQGPEAIYFAFDRAFEKGTILFDIAPAAQSPLLHWEYLTDMGWVALSVRDNTSRLNTTGILSYSTPSRAVRSRVWGREAYWIRLAADESAPSSDHLPKTRLMAIHENAVPATARTPGDSSALPAGAYSTLASALPGVLRAVNPLAAYGGAEAESERGVIERLNTGISHGGRPITPGDYESLAKAASTRVLRARYYPHTDENGRDSYGEACLVLLQHGSGTEGFDELREEVNTFLAPLKALGSERLSIVMPRFIAVSVYADVEIDRADETLPVKEGIENALSALLSPQNWVIGRLPTPGQIEAAIRAVPGAAYITKAETAYEIRRGINADYARTIREAFVLPVNGRHEIRLGGEKNSAPA